MPSPSSSPSTLTPRQAPRAVRSVLESPAFLERILATVPIHTLLISQRVNKIFRETILQSPLLQQLLWLAPVPPDFAYTVDLFTDWRCMAGFPGTNQTKMRDLLSWVRDHEYYKEPRPRGSGTIDMSTLKPTGFWDKVKHQVHKARVQLYFAWVRIFGVREEIRI